MTNHDVLLAQLEHHGKLLEKLSEKLSIIDQSITAIAVHSEQITTVQNNVMALWVKYDAAFNPEGTLARLQAQASACPKEDLRTQIKALWGAVGLVIALIGTLKIWG